MLRLFFWLMAIHGLAAGQADRFLIRTFKGKTEMTLPYRLFVPAGYAPGKAMPVVLALHGAGERGIDNTSQLTKNRLATSWAEDSVQARHPSLVIAPQCPSTDSWVDYYKPVDKVSIRPILAKVMELLDSLAQEFNLDPDRIYVVGLSMGGFATWDLLARYPGRFAAAVPICGAGDTTKVALMRNTPLWIFHGDKDNVVPVAGSRTMVEALKRVGASPRYTEYPGVMHDSWTPALKDPGLVPWVYAQTRPGGTRVMSPGRTGSLVHLKPGWNLRLDGRRCRANR